MKGMECEAERKFSILMTPGFSQKVHTVVAPKGVTEGSGRSHSVEFKWSSNVDHVTLMPVVLLTVERGILLPSHRIREMSYLPCWDARDTWMLPSRESRMIYRDPAGMDSDGFF